jgi:replicative DNA helicase
MAKSDRKPLPKKSSYEVACESEQYVDDRRKGKIKSLRTKFKRLNSFIMGGFEMNTITCISALSGAGKSTLAKCLMDSIAELNKDVKFNQYIFNFEMVSHQNIARSVVTSSDMSLYKMYSVEEHLSDVEFAELQKHYDILKKRDNVWFIDTSGTPAKILESLEHYYITECKPYGRTLFYVIDHLLLTEGKQGQSEKAKIDDLMVKLINLKKEIQVDGGSSVGIVLSQMNREIRDKERIKNPDMHRTRTNDLFGASSIEFACDYIIFSHIPAKLDLPYYTTRKLPVRMKVGEKWIQIPYFELVKNRSGVSDITIPLVNKLHRFDFDEMNKDTFNEMHKAFLDGEEAVYEESQSKLNFN